MTNGAATTELFTPLFTATAKAFESCIAQGMNVEDATRAVCEIIDSLAA